MISKFEKNEGLINYFGEERSHSDPCSGMVAVKIFSGDWYVTSNPKEVLVTILGSCVAACIHDPVLKIGGMNHFLLPGNLKATDDESARYGLYAMEKLINELLKLGAVKERLQVKIFGGARVINYSSDIGNKNITFIKNFLQSDGYKLTAEHVGGEYPRRIHFYPVIGKVKMKLVEGQEKTKIISNERMYEESLKKKPVEGEAELF
jgi:chemotaxis protein CheD